MRADLTRTRDGALGEEFPGFDASELGAKGVGQVMLKRKCRTRG